MMILDVCHVLWIDHKGYNYAAGGTNGNNIMPIQHPNCCFHREYHNSWVDKPVDYFEEVTASAGFTDGY